MYRKDPRPATIFERKYIEANYQKAKENIIEYETKLQKEYDKLTFWQRVNILNDKHMKLHSNLLFCTNYRESLNGVRSALESPDYFGLDIEDYKFIRYWANCTSDSDGEGSGELPT